MVRFLLARRGISIHLEQALMMKRLVVSVAVALLLAGCSGGTAPDAGSTPAGGDTTTSAPAGDTGAAPATPAGDATPAPATTP